MSDEQKEVDRLVEMAERYNRAVENIRLAYANGWIKCEVERLPTRPEDDCIRFSVSLVPKRKIRIL